VICLNGSDIRLLLILIILILILRLTLLLLLIRVLTLILLVGLLFSLLFGLIQPLLLPILIVLENLLPFLIVVGEHQLFENLLIFVELPSELVGRHLQLADLRGEPSV
jgi:hypothetical protein